MKTHYEILGLDQVFSQDELKQSYRERAKDFHPDRFVGDEISDTQAQEAHQEMTALNEAYRVLSDPELRRMYDQELELAQQSAQSHVVETPIKPQESKPYFSRILLVGVVGFSLFLIISNSKAPNKRNFKQELNTAQTLFKPQVDQALKGNLPSLTETMAQPEGLLLKRALSPELSPKNCLNAFPDQLQAK